MIRTFYVLGVAGFSLGCGGQVEATAVDAGNDASSSPTDSATLPEGALPDDNACADCGATLSQACSTTSCPPSMSSSPSFLGWEMTQMTIDNPTNSSPLCLAFTKCPEMTMMAFTRGLDGHDEYIFDTSTGELLALASTGPSWEGKCTASKGGTCIPKRCVRFGQLSYGYGPEFQVGAFGISHNCPVVTADAGK